MEAQPRQVATPNSLPYPIGRRKPLGAANARHAPAPLKAATTRRRKESARSQPATPPQRRAEDDCFRRRRSRAPEGLEDDLDFDLVARRRRGV